MNTTFLALTNIFFSLWEHFRPQKWESNKRCAKCKVKGSIALQLLGLSTVFIHSGKYNTSLAHINSTLSLMTKNHLTWLSSITSCCYPNSAWPPVSSCISLGPGCQFDVFLERLYFLLKYCFKTLSIVYTFKCVGISVSIETYIYIM